MLNTSLPRLSTGSVGGLSSPTVNLNRTRLRLENLVFCGANACSDRKVMQLAGLDALPDRFGNMLIDVWLAETGRKARDFNPVDRLCYMGTRATVALEFEPAIRHRNRETSLEIARSRRQGSERASATEGDVRRTRRSRGTRGHSERRHVRRWSASEGGAGLESEDGRVSVGSGGCAGGFRALDTQVRRHLEQPRPGAGRSPRIRPNRTCLPSHGRQGRNRDVGLPAVSRRRSQSLHDPAVRPRREGPQDSHCNRWVHCSTTTSTILAPTLTSRRFFRFGIWGSAWRSWKSSSAVHCSTS